MRSNSCQILESKRLRLRPTDLSDAELILELFNSPKWIQNIGDRQVHTLDQAEGYIADKMLPQIARLGFGNFTIELGGERTKLGVCGLYDREGLPGLDLGFALLPQYEKQGFAFEAATTVLQWATTSASITCLSAITTHENLDSQRLLKNLGFEFEKIIRIPNDSEELMLFTWSPQPSGQQSSLP